MNLIEGPFRAVEELVGVAPAPEKQLIEHPMTIDCAISHYMTRRKNARGLQG